MAASPMLRYLRPAVSQVIGTMTQQISSLEETAGQVRRSLPEIGEAWIGEDADAFSAEVSSALIPEVAVVIATVGGMVVGISRAANVIEQADQKARGMAEELDQQLRGIL